MPTKGTKREKVACPKCGQMTGSIALHMPHCKGEVSEMVPEAVGAGASSAPVPGQPRSRRGRSLYNERSLTPLEQIPVLPSMDAGYAHGAWAYYIRPEGATISEALILYPNGGVPEMDDLRMQSKFGLNHEYYQRRQEDKGFEFIGTTLTESGVRRLVEVLAKNRGDEILFCEDEVVNARYSVRNSDIPSTRDRERKRANQFEHRLEYLRQPLDEDGLISELREIAHAQMLSNVDPNVLRVMRAMIGEVNQKTEDMVRHFQTKGTVPTGVKSISGDRSASAADFVGVASLDA